MCAVVCTLRHGVVTVADCCARPDLRCKANGARARRQQGREKAVDDQGAAILKESFCGTGRRCNRLESEGCFTVAR